MNISILLVNALGIYLAICGIFLLFRRKDFMGILKDFFTHRAMMWLAGLFLIVLGGVIIFQQPDIFVVLLIGWLTLIKGVIYIIYPDMFIKMAGKPIPAHVTNVWGVIYIVLGLWFISL